MSECDFHPRAIALFALGEAAVAFLGKTGSTPGRTEFSPRSARPCPDGWSITSGSCGSFSRSPPPPPPNQAAELHHLSQLAVTQALNKLEQRTGAPLFHRTPQGLFVSELGRLFARRSERALAHLEAATTSLAPPLKLTACGRP
jgi:Bacterial regulatory helix-turn-helix protein, lysR family